MTQPDPDRRTARFLFEAMMLKRTWRTGYAFLGKGKESVAAHTYGMLVIAYMMSKLSTEPVNLERLLLLCLLHDLPEARTGDANAVQKKYLEIFEDRAIDHMTRGLLGGEEIKEVLKEWKAGVTLEARIARDADQLDMLVSLKEKMDQGSADAGMWISHVMKRLRTDCARRLARAILDEHWSSWWMEEFEEGIEEEE